MNKQTINIVPGYGSYLRKETKRYLDFVSDNLKDGDIVITSGACTQQKTAPNIREASFMKEYIEKNSNKKLLFIKEEKSLTTRENLQNCKKIIQKLDLDKNIEIVIFCDLYRSLKIWIMSLFIFGMPIPKIMSIDVFQSFVKTMKQLLFSTPSDFLEIFFPFIRKIKKKRKNKMIKET
jgi:hypothetical protein